MTLLEAVALLAAGIAAGTINTIVGSGTLISFPVLIGFGYDPLVANVSNTIGLVPGSISGSVGYREQLRGQARRVATLGLITSVGGIAGGVLLLALPASAFEAVVPAFIGTALVLVIIQPRLAAWLARRPRARARPWALPAAVLVIGVYGGYFGAGQGILLIAVLGLALPLSLQQVNGLKTVLAGVANTAGGIVFAVAAPVDWTVALLIAVGSVFGGLAGARIGVRLPAAALRVVIVVIGCAAIVRLVAG
jgi:uncharacterized membrane protein YfcA